MTMTSTTLSAMMRSSNTLHNCDVGMTRRHLFISIMTCEGGFCPSIILMNTVCNIILTFID